MKLKDGKTYYHVKPVFQKAGAFFDSSSAWSLIESELWQYGRPEDFATVAANVLRSWESKWGRVKVNKGPRSWTWTVPFEDYAERGLKRGVTNTPPLMKDRSQWQYVHKTGRRSADTPTSPTLASSFSTAPKASASTLARSGPWSSSVRQPKEV